MKSEEEIRALLSESFKERDRRASTFTDKGAPDDKGLWLQAVTFIGLLQWVLDEAQTKGEEEGAKVRHEIKSETARWAGDPLVGDVVDIHELAPHLQWLRCLRYGRFKGGSATVYGGGRGMKAGDASDGRYFQCYVWRSDFKYSYKLIGELMCIPPSRARRWVVYGKRECYLERWGGASTAWDNGLVPC